MAGCGTRREAQSLRLWGRHEPGSPQAGGRLKAPWSSTNVSGNWRAGECPLSKLLVEGGNPTQVAAGLRRWMRIDHPDWMALLTEKIDRERRIRVV